MEQYIIDDILDRIDELLEILNEYEDAFYVAIEVAHQLRDEVTQVEPVSEDEE